LIYGCARESMVYAFDKETNSEKISDGHWQLQLVSDWKIGENRMAVI